MSSVQRKRVAYKLWQRNAEEIRKKLTTRLSGILNLDFEGQQESIAFGKVYWNKAETTDYSDPTKVASVLNKFLAENGNKTVYWLHKFTNDAGLLVVLLHNAVAFATDNRGIPQDDLFLAEPTLKYGICFEVGEAERHLRYWAN